MRKHSAITYGRDGPTCPSTRYRHVRELPTFRDLRSGCNNIDTISLYRTYQIIVNPPGNPLALTTAVVTRWPPGDLPGHQLYEATSRQPTSPVPILDFAILAFTATNGIPLERGRSTPSISRHRRTHIRVQTSVTNGRLPACPVQIPDRFGLHTYLDDD